MQFRTQRFVRFIGAAAAAGGLLAACGGGLLLVLGFIGSAGGDWVQDDQPAVAGLQIRSSCGDDLKSECRINIGPVGGVDLYAKAFDIEYFSNLPGCAPNGNGRADGNRLELTGCFTGAYVNINQVVSDDGRIRMFFDYAPPLDQGVWVELQQGQRRFAFNGNAQDVDVNGVKYRNSTGCELGTTKVPVDLSMALSDIRNPAGPFETTIRSFTIQGGGGAWSGQFVGVSGMRLTRGNEVLELERRAGTETC